MKKFVAVFAGALISYCSLSQDFLGIRQMNYSGVMQADMNPAFLVDNRMKVDVTLFGMHASGYNNHLYMNTRLMPFGWKRSFTDTNDAQVDAWLNSANFDKIVPADSTQNFMKPVGSGGANFFTIDNDNLARKVYANVNIDILNGMVQINRENAIGFGIKFRHFTNVDHVAPEVLTLSVNELEVPSLWDLDLNDELLHLSTNTWMEYHASYARIFYDEGEHFIKAGGRLKFLQGIAAAYVYTDNVDYNFDNADTAAYITGDFQYGYSNSLARWVEPIGTEEPLPADPGAIVQEMFKLNSKLGLGLDIGGVYEWRPEGDNHKYDMDGETDLWKRNENKYKLRVAWGINDIGGMKYTKGELSRDFSMHANVLDMDVFGNVKGPRSWDTTITALADSGQLSILNTTEATFNMNLPTSMNIGVDYKLGKDVYINLYGALPLRSKKDAHKVSYGGILAITPRYDHKWFGVSLPMSVNGIYGARMGLGLRLGPIILGTGDLKPFLAPGNDMNLKGADFYMAAKVPIPYGPVKDRDEDKVSDKVEKAHRKELRKSTGNKEEEGCLEIPGVWEFKGCPDSDGDHIQDSEDACPYDPGTPEFNGCPDRDGDKIIDKEDDCPDDPGLAEFKGCPDKDEDGIMDKEDDCPDVAGIAEFNGCPDRDEDGVQDSDDLCPDNPGPKENEGCPDTDNDGIFDFLDRCPEEAGPKENDGCPWPDTDEDGLLDKDDKCPYNAGPVENDGCPYTDTDGDGVIDKDDECVNTPGLPELKGCPEIKEDEQEILNTAFENLEFETGRAIIKEESFESLEELADLLVKKDKWKLEIAGHTDNVGAEQANLILSKKRSEAVAAFLNQRGVNVDRLIVKYFGESKPIDTNDTKEGRQRNRRVEMTVIFE